MERRVSHFFPSFMVMVIIPFLCENILSFELAGILSIILFAIIVIVSKLFEEMNIWSGKRWIFFCNLSLLSPLLLHFSLCCVSYSSDSFVHRDVSCISYRQCAYSDETSVYVWYVSHSAESKKSLSLSSNIYQKQLRFTLWQLQFRIGPLGLKAQIPRLITVHRLYWAAKKFLFVKVPQHFAGKYNHLLIRAKK